MRSSEAIPTSAAAFHNHPLFCLLSRLKRNEILVDNEPSIGTFRGKNKVEKVYRRSAVSTAHSAGQWMRQCRAVREDELDKPVKILKRATPSSGMHSSSSSSSSSSRCGVALQL